MDASVDLWWIPLGAGGHFVRLNGRIYEAIQAKRQRRARQALYHSALEVTVPEGRFVIETAWPIPAADGATRGVVLTGPVFSPRLGRAARFLRYEVRRWPDGAIFDSSWASPPDRVTRDIHTARRVLAVVPSVPALVWGRRIPGTSDMWNSNSVIAWILERSNVPASAWQPPAGGRAPGWQAGIDLAGGRDDLLTA